jgi:hypothetical protein
LHLLDSRRGAVHPARSGFLKLGGLLFRQIADPQHASQQLGILGVRRGLLRLPDR